jgi:hypothetical protein
MKFESVKQQIELTSQIAELEAHWWKNPREKLQEAMIARSPVSVMPDYTKSGKMDIHTHPGHLKPSFPSLQDLIAFNKNNSRLMVVAATNLKGEVVGYTFINKHPGKVLFKQIEISQVYEARKTRYYQIESEIKKIKEEISILKKLPPTTEAQTKISELYTKWSNFARELTNIIQEQIKINGWRMRFVAMKGYQFKNGYYLPKPPPPPSTGSGGVAISIPPKNSIDLAMEEKRKRDKEFERLKRIREIHNLEKQRNRQ